MNKSILALTLLCGFLLGVVAGPWLWPEPLLKQQAEPEPAAQQAVVAPPPAPEPVAAAEIPAEPEMQLKGVFVIGDGTRSVALIQTGEGQPQPYRVDQKLPNEYVVKTIARNVVEVEKNGTTISLPLVRSSSSSAPEATEVEIVTPAAADTPAVESSAVPAEAPVAAENKPAPVETGQDG